MEFHWPNAAKFFLYLIGKILLIAVAVGFVWFMFLSAITSANVNVLVKDAFSKRASVMLQPTDNSNTELIYKLFSSEYVASSQIISKELNSEYVITSYEQRTDVELKAVWSWKKTATLIVTDKIDDVKLAYADGVTEAKSKPVIPSGKYKVTVRQDTENNWIVSKIEQLETLEASYVLPEPVEATDTEEE